MIYPEDLLVKNQVKLMGVNLNTKPEKGTKITIPMYNSQTDAL